MALVPGTRFGAYEIVSLLGQGGMGEVYRARDTRLDRTVALKILPESLAADPVFRERFDREARAISQLTHPHICTLYDVGEQQGTAFLVMEYLDGETLADRLREGALPLEQALKIAIEIVDALDKAHRAGITHRDLKPGNIMLTKCGAKLLDFGIAKTNAPAVSVSSATTMPTTPVSLTAQGTILGTFQYMAPEQIEGMEADARTDLFAFGCVVFEMLTGRKAFEGNTRASLIGAILKDEPPLVSQLQPVSSPSLDRIVATCLAKETEDRWQTARDLMRELKWVAEGGVSPPARSARSRAPAWTFAAAALMLAIASLLIWAQWRTAAPLRAPLRMSVELGADVSQIAPIGSTTSLSPDGSMLAFVGQKGDSATPQLYVRQLDQLRATPLSGTDGARDAFFSPDGQWIAFFADSKLKKISITGGAAVTICDVPNDRGGTWGDDGMIVFQADASVGSSLMRVSSAGGKVEPFVKPADIATSPRWPQMLPGGRAILYTAAAGGGFADANIVVQPLPRGAPKVVRRGGYYAHYLASGHLVYVHDRTLFAAPFSVDRLELTGQAVPVVDGVSGNAGTGGSQFAVSESGTLVYVPGQISGLNEGIEWMDRMGTTTVLRATAGAWSNPQFSPDGQRLAIDISDGKQIDVWVYEWARDRATKLTFDPADDLKPVWAPDGRRIVFASRRGGGQNLYWQHADGTGGAQRLTESANAQLPGSWHPSGKFLAFTELNPQSGQDLMILPMSGDESSGWRPGRPIVFLTTPFDEVEPMFSPDGRWLAYHSDEAGRNEVYVRPFPGPGGKWQFSTVGGNTPTWSRGRHELLYRGIDNRIMVASYSMDGDSFRADKPRHWSDRPLTPRPRQRDFDLHPDGNRMALSATGDSPESKPDKVVFIFNFFDELRRIAPVKK